MKRFAQGHQMSYTDLVTPVFLARDLSTRAPGEHRILEQAEGEGGGVGDKIASGGWSFPSPTLSVTHMSLRG